MNIDEILQGAMVDVVNLATDSFGDLASDTEQDIIDFTNESREKLDLWTQAAAAGFMDDEEFAFLLGARMTNAKMRALTRAGIVQTRIEHFRKGVIDIIVKAVFSAIA
ncbi:MAG: hypothetical protein AAF468_06485 [Pseudomonadota bacterium]